MINFYAFISSSFILYSLFAWPYTYTNASQDVCANETLLVTANEKKFYNLRCFPKSKDSWTKNTFQDITLSWHHPFFINDRAHITVR